MLEPLRLPSLPRYQHPRRGIRRPTRRTPPDAEPGDGAPPAGPQVLTRCFSGIDLMPAFHSPDWGALTAAGPWAMRITKSVVDAGGSPTWR
jgi:hypothetical protein